MKTVSDYVEYLAAMYASWKSKSDILADVQEINRSGFVRVTKGEPFCREIVEALALRSPESAQALGSAWRVSYEDRSSVPTARKFNVGDKVSVRISIDPGYGQIVDAKFENGSWYYWVQKRRQAR